MQIYGFIKTTLLDFPGLLAATVFTGGCNFRCPFCHNSRLVLNPSCEVQIPEEEVLSHLKKRRGILEGLCISGGEPTLCPDLLDFMEQVKSYGYQVKLDTNGSHPDVVREAIRRSLVDYVAMDIKASPAAYDLLSGTATDFDAIDETRTLLQTSGIAYEFRTTVMHPYHTPDMFLQIGQWLQNPASPYYLQEFRSSPDVLSGHGLSACSAEEMQQFKTLLLPYLPNTHLRGMEEPEP